MRRAAFLALFALLAAAQDFSEIRIELLGKEFGYTEGPAWNSKDGYLVFSDTPANKIMKWVPGQPVEVLRADAGGPSGNAFDAEGRLYTCETHSRRVTRRDKKGAIEVLAERWEGKRLNAPNDIVVSRAGHVWFTDPAFGEQSDHRELDFYGVYHIPPKGPVKLIARSKGRPNGIALAASGKLLFIADSDQRNVRAFDLDRNGEVSNERVFVSKLPTPPGGIRTDEKGNLYVAAGDVLIYTPEGTLLRKIETGTRIANLGFGESDMHTLILTGSGGVWRARLDVKGSY
jgi:sugar lactone lactonase YvrE